MDDLFFCAVACDILLACKGYFYWVISASTARCITLRSTGSAQGTRTTLRGYSYLRKESFDSTTMPPTTTAPNTTPAAPVATAVMSDAPFDLLDLNVHDQGAAQLTSGAYLFDGRTGLALDRAPELSVAGFSLVVTATRATGGSGKGGG